MRHQVGAHSNDDYPEQKAISEAAHKGPDPAHSGITENDAPPRTTTVVLLGLIALGLAARFVGLSQQSLWIDELTSLQFALPPGGAGGSALDRLNTDLNPPLYTVLLHFWLQLAPVGDAAVRLPSAVFGALTIACAYLQGRRILQPTALFCFVALMSCSYGAIYYAQEARSYSLLLLLSTVITLATLSANRAIREQRAYPYGQLVLAATAGLVASYTHYFGILIYGAACTVLCISSLQLRRIPIPVVIAGALVLALFVPWVLYHVPQMGNEYLEGNVWEAFSFGKLIHAFGWFAGLVTGNIAAALLLLGLSAFAVWRYRANLLKDDVLVAAFLVAVIAAVYAIAITLYRPIVSGRNLLILMPAVYIFIARVLAVGLPRPVFALAAPLTVAVLLFGSLYDYYRPHKQQWRESAAFVANLKACETGNIVMLGGHRILHPNIRHFRHYLPSDSALDLRSYSEFPDQTTLRTWADDGQCPVLLWAVHLPRQEFLKIIAGLGWSEETAVLKEFVGAYLMIRPGTGSQD